MGDLYDLLQGTADPAERRRIKAAALALLDDLVGTSIDRGDFRVTLTALRLVQAGDVPAGFPANEAILFRLRVNRISNGNNVTPADLNPIVVVNPPILVPDPSGEVTFNGEAFREDLREVLRSVIRDLARQRLG